MGAEFGIATHPWGGGGERSVEKAAKIETEREVQEQSPRREVRAAASEGPTDNDKSRVWHGCTTSYRVAARKLPRRTGGQ